jgi:hypothetical protein
MAIDRGPWNALVDDDGSNLVGTVWNKDKIKTVILDPVDAAIVAPAWQTVAFNVANFWTGVTGAHVLVNRYLPIAPKAMIWMMQISNAPIPAPATSYLPLKIPGGGSMPAQGIMMPMAQSYEGAGFAPAYLLMLDSTTAAIARNQGGNWTSTPLTLMFTAIVALN